FGWHKIKDRARWGAAVDFAEKVSAWRILWNAVRTVCWSPTLSAGKSGKDGARRLTGTTNSLEGIDLGQPLLLFLLAGGLLAGVDLGLLGLGVEGRGGSARGLDLVDRNG